MERRANVNDLNNSDNVRNVIKPQDFILAPVYVRRANMEEAGYPFNRKNFNMESCTQTSKTIIELAKIEAGYMSPDSLDCSPRGGFNQVQAEKEYGLDSHHLYQIHMLPKQHHNQQPNRYQEDPNRYYFSRVENYPCKYIIQDKNVMNQNYRKSDNGYCHIPQNHTPGNVECEIEPSKMTTIYNRDVEPTLEPTQNNPVVFKMTDKIPEKQHDGPLINQYINHKQKIAPKKALPRQNLKSQSYVETAPPKKHFDVEPIKINATSNVIPEKIEKHKRTMQFHKPSEMDNKGDLTNRECNVLMSNFQSKRSNSFMSPTLASEQKSLKQAVDSVKNLVGATCKGRTSSPRINGIKIGDRIPYIDQSQCDLLPRVARSEELQKTSAECPKLNLKLSASSVFDSSGSSENGLCLVLNHVKSSDWNCSLKGLAEVVELARNGEPDVLLPYMTIVNQKLLDLLRSPRSHVCRIACQLTGHLFEAIKDTRRPEFDDIVNALLYKTADANKFIRQDANLALDCMVTHIPTFHAIRSLCSKGPTHRNPLVRCATVRLLICAVVITGPDLLLTNPNLEQSRKRVVMNLHHFLEDKNAETRKYAERLYKILVKQVNFDIYLRKFLDKTNLEAFYRNVKFLKKG